MFEGITSNLIISIDIVEIFFIIACAMGQTCKMKLKQTWTVLVVTLSVATGTKVRAQVSTDDIKALREQIEALDQKVRVLERQRELDAEDATAKAKDVPQVSIGQNGFV